jgi:hypothetical protein
MKQAINYNKQFPNIYVQTKELRDTRIQRIQKNDDEIFKSV